MAEGGSEAAVLVDVQQRDSRLHTCDTSAAEASGGGPGGNGACGCNAAEAPEEGKTDKGDVAAQITIA